MTDIAKKFDKAVDIKVIVILKQEDMSCTRSHRVQTNIRKLSKVKMY